MEWIKFTYINHIHLDYFNDQTIGEMIWQFYYFENNSRLYLRFENLFNGDKALGENMNLFINENWMDILGELKPGITEAFSQILGNLIDAIFKKISYDDIFL